MRYAMQEMPPVFPAPFSHPFLRYCNKRLAARLVLFAAFLGSVLVLDAWQRPARLEKPQAQMPHNLEPGTLSNLQPQPLHVVSRGKMPMPTGAKAAHASNMLVMPSERDALLSAFWFSGERESGPRVEIVASQWGRRRHTWSHPEVVANRHVLGKTLGYGVRRLGNPVSWLDADGRIHLFVVATGGGGWAASRVLHLRQVADTKRLATLEFEPLETLPLSWLWNTSMLVRNAPLPLKDGGMVLPVHFELGRKFPLALRFDAHGNFSGMVHISQREYALQPTLLAVSEEKWIALMRDERPNGRVLAARSNDGGAHWSDIPDLPLPNPDAAIAGLSLAPNLHLLAHNSSPGTRAQLDLSQSPDGVHWTTVLTLEKGSDDDEFSYPAMVWADGSLWVTYTVDRKHLAWQQLSFTDAPAGVEKP